MKKYLIILVALLFSSCASKKEFVWSDPANYCWYCDSLKQVFIDNTRADNFERWEKKHLGDRLKQ